MEGRLPDLPISKRKNYLKNLQIRIKNIKFALKCENIGAKRSPSMNTKKDND